MRSKRSDNSGHSLDLVLIRLSNTLIPANFIMLIQIHVRTISVRQIPNVISLKIIISAFLSLVLFAMGSDVKKPDRNGMNLVNMMSSRRALRKAMGA